MSSLDKLVFKPEQIKETRKYVALELNQDYKDNSEGTKLDPDNSKFDDDSNHHENDNGYIENREERLEEINTELEKYRIKKLEGIENEIRESEKRKALAKKESEETVFQILQDAKERAKREKEGTTTEIEKLSEQTKLKVERMIKEAEMHVSEIEHEAYQKGLESGRELGIKNGEAESKRLINRLGEIVSRAVDVREKLIIDSEKQMAEIVLMIARKIIKDEIAERNGIVLNNIQETLKQIKNRESIDIRVNLADLDLTTSHKEQILGMMESLSKVNIYEDTRVDRGGCIIETNVGSIDARVSVQFKQIEDAVRNAKPI